MLHKSPLQNQRISCSPQKKKSISSFPLTISYKYSEQHKTISLAFYFSQDGYTPQQAG